MAGELLPLDDESIAIVGIVSFFANESVMSTSDFEIESVVEISSGFFNYPTKKKHTPKKMILQNRHLLHLMDLQLQKDSFQLDHIKGNSVFHKQCRCIKVHKSKRPNTYFLPLF